MSGQWPLIESACWPGMPPTRYQGSKRKMAAWIVDQLRDLEFDTAVDAFGGSGAVAFELKRRGKSVTYNDVLRFNHQIGLALIANDGIMLSDDDAIDLQRRHVGQSYDDFVTRTFGGIYYTDDENRWIDTVVQNITRMGQPIQRALAYYSLFQSALAKRPYNLFHRRNLYMRQADVRRSFGNKATWDRPFSTHFARFVNEANNAAFDNGCTCRATCSDVLNVEGHFDLAYIDPPYFRANGVGVDYHGFYHFLEGLTDYTVWKDRIDWDSKHLRLRSRPNPWCDPTRIRGEFDAVFERFSGGIVIVSYRSDGLPSIVELESMLRRHKSRVRIADFNAYQYALSTNKRSREMLLIAS